MSIDNFDPVNEKHEAHDRILKYFGNIETYFDFVLKRQGEQMQQGFLYLDSPKDSSKQKDKNIFGDPTFILTDYKQPSMKKSTTTNFIQQQIYKRFLTT